MVLNDNAKLGGMNYREIKVQTRRKFTAEEKIRILPEDLRDDKLASYGMRL